ncbi:TetR/AcrR family transcriptional regulator [Arthrobacter sp. TMS1-12-1]
MPETLPVPLRERRRAETWAEIHEAAALLAVEGGIGHTTIEAIAGRAGVSPRTFFNYFRSKEDAVLGLREPSLDPELLSGLSLERDLLGQVSRLLLTVAQTVLGSTDAARRQRLMKDQPHLRQRQMEYMIKAEDLVRRGLSEWLVENPDWSGSTGFSAEEISRMLVMVGGVPVRFTLTAPGHTPGAGLTAEDIAPAITLLHHLQRNLS